VECQRLEEELRSPLLPLWTAELSLQYSSWVGDWDNGIATGERTIAQARALNQRTLLPRLLVWTGLIYLWRHDLDRARAYFDQAWTLSGAGTAAENRLDVQTVLPAHMGLAAYHLETDNLDEAIRIGREARVPVNIFHLKIGGQGNWGRMPAVIRTIEAAQKSGLDIGANMYPFTATSTDLTSIVPAWALQGGYEAFVNRLKEPATRARVADALRGGRLRNAGASSILIRGRNKRLDKIDLRNPIQRIAGFLEKIQIREG
jgi:hypothetical protein